MPFDVKQFIANLKKAGTLSEEAEKALEKALAEETVSKFIESGFLRQEDYSRKMDEAKLEQKKALDNLESLKTQLATTSSADKAEVTRLQNEIKTARAELDATRKVVDDAETMRLRIIQEARQREGGESFLKAIGLDSPELRFVPPKVEPPPAVPEKKEPSDFEKKFTEFQATATEQARFLANWTPTILEAQRVHHELTGKPLNVREFVSKFGDAMTKGEASDPWAFFETTYDIPRLTKEKETAELTATIRKQVEEEFARKSADRGIPGEFQPPSDFIQQLNKVDGIDNSQHQGDTDDAQMIAEAGRELAAAMSGQSSSSASQT